MWHRIKPTTRRSWSYSLSSNCNFALLDFNLKFYDAASYCCFCISCFVFVFCFLFLCFLCTSVSCLICLLPLMCFACFFKRRFIGCACSFCFVRAPLPSPALSSCSLQTLHLPCRQSVSSFRWSLE